jgi:hypothetical protein
MASWRLGRSIERFRMLKQEEDVRFVAERPRIHGAPAAAARRSTQPA